jgi:hypothetical protein
MPMLESRRMKKYKLEGHMDAKYIPINFYLTTVNIHVFCGVAQIVEMV